MIPFLTWKLREKQARKGFRPISASEVLLVRKVNDLINKRTEHWSCNLLEFHKNSMVI